MKILIADDDSDLLGLIGFTLTQAGYLVVKAIDGPSAIRAFEAEQPDIIVLDINMPGASGFQVCEAVRQKSRVPIMMLTASIMPAAIANTGTPEKSAAAISLKMMAGNSTK